MSVLPDVVLACLEAKGNGERSKRDQSANGVRGPELEGRDGTRGQCATVGGPGGCSVGLLEVGSGQQTVDDLDTQQRRLAGGFPRGH